MLCLVRKFALVGVLSLSLIQPIVAVDSQPASVTKADYERAVMMLGDRTAPLVDGGVRGVTWLDDGSVVYGKSNAGKTEWMRFDPATGASVPAIDQKALAEAR